jgi:hypothetical protein
MILVPRGPEHRAVRRGCAGSTALTSILAIPGGGASAGALEHAAGSNFVILGLCGALDPTLHVGDVVVCTSALHAHGSAAFDAAFTAHVGAATGARSVQALTLDRIVTSREERAKLHDETGAAIVEMEGFHLATRLAGQGRIVAMVRVVSDDASYDLPDISRAIGVNGTLRPFELVTAFARAPRKAARFIGDSRRALKVLEAATARLISH